MPCHPEGFESKPRSGWKNPWLEENTTPSKNLIPKNNRQICHRLWKKTTKPVTSNSTLLESYANCWVSWSNDSKKCWSWNPGIENVLPWDSWFTVAILKSFKLATKAFLEIHGAGNLQILPDLLGCRSWWPGIPRQKDKEDALKSHGTPVVFHHFSESPFFRITLFKMMSILEKKTSSTKKNPCNGYLVTW